jgi:aspartyl-tRNA(Asn)/glutamyl-tRNA(Gln) amidotransferase subunit A
MSSGPRTITEASELIRRGELTPTELLEQCLARVDLYEPKVRAWAYLDREGAREQAERLTKEQQGGKNRGPLHGIPIGVKDIIDVFDLPTGCGSKLWANSYARRDATCVARLRQAGAVILGKTVTCAYASFDPPVTRNPWNLDRTPGGSSSGSAAAVACGMCLGSLGTQTGGSITRPASYCGVYSLKPKHGRVSVDGVLPLAPSLDHVGVMANCVRDLAILFQVVAGPDERSPRTIGMTTPDAVFLIDRFLGPTALNPTSVTRPPRFGRLRGFFDDRADASVRSAMSHFCREVGRPDLRTVGHDRGTPNPVTDLALPASFIDIHTKHRRIMAVEAAEYHRERLARHPADYPPRVTELLEEGLGCSATDYSEALTHRTYAEIDIDNMIRLPSMHLLTPATSEAAPVRETTGDPVMNSPWSYTGLPTVSLPIGWTDDGLPLSAQVTGLTESEGWLLMAAAWCELVTRFPRRELSL